MARPRQSAKILRLKGSFDHDPARTRVDIEGTGEFNREPPEDLKKKYHAAWNYIVERLPQISLTSSDEPLVRHAAKLYARMVEFDDCLETTLRLSGPFVQCLINLGMTPAARAKFGSSGKDKTKNRFERLKDDE